MFRHFVKLPFLVLFVSVFALCASAQDSLCASGDAPPLLGLRLGMSAAEARAVFGKDLKIKVKTKGDRVFFQNYIEKKPPARLADVRALYLRFLDGRLYQIEIFYAERADSPTLEAFAASLARRMNFPAGAMWRFENNKASIDCGAFTIVADKPVNPRVELTDAAKLAEAKARRKKKD